MAEEVEESCPDCPNCMPGWVMTFADLMSLLMCFFVLLLSFAEMDIQKYKTLSGSMEFAFGVQREIEADSIPKGTSIIAKNFTPGSPRQTITNEIRQDTTNEIKENLEWSEGESDGKKRSNSEDNQLKSDVKEETTLKEDLAAAERIKQKEQEEMEDEAEAIEEKLEKEIAEDLLEVEVDDGKIVIRIKEKGSFPSGRAKLRPGFNEVMEKLREVVLESKRDVLVAGHTDSRSIRSLRFRSNWELSAARAVSVVHELLKNKGIDQERIMVQGHADSKPLVDNKTKENRSKNRRVEIVLVKGKDKERIRKLADVNKAPEKKKVEEVDAEEGDDEWDEEGDSGPVDEDEEESLEDEAEEDTEATPKVNLQDLYQETAVDDEEEDDNFGDDAFDDLNSTTPSTPIPAEIDTDTETDIEAEDTAIDNGFIEPQLATPKSRSAVKQPAQPAVDWGDWPTFPEEQTQEKTNTNQ